MLLTNSPLLSLGNCTAVFTIWEVLLVLHSRNFTSSQMETVTNVFSNVSVTELWPFIPVPHALDLHSLSQSEVPHSPMVTHTLEYSMESMSTLETQPELLVILMTVPVPETLLLPVLPALLPRLR